jgi:hypothetical protein
MFRSAVSKSIAHSRSIGIRAFSTPAPAPASSGGGGSSFFQRLTSFFAGFGVASIYFNYYMYEELTISNARILKQLKEQQK